MNISDIEIKLKDSFDETKAIATVFLEEGFKILNIQVIEGKTGMYVRMAPKATFSCNGLNKEKRLETEERLLIQKKVINSYSLALEEVKKEKIRKEQEELKQKELEELKQKELEKVQDGKTIKIKEELVLMDNKIPGKSIESDETLRKYEENNNNRLDEIEDVEVISREQVCLDINDDTENKIDEILNKNSIKLYNNESIDEEIDINELLVDKKRLFPGNELFVNDLNLKPRINMSIANMLAKDM